MQPEKFGVEVLCREPGPTCSLDEGQLWERARPTSSVTCRLLSGSLRHSAPTLLYFSQPEVRSTLLLHSPTGFLSPFFRRKTRIYFFFLKKKKQVVV